MYLTHIQYEASHKKTSKPIHFQHNKLQIY